MMLCPYKVGSLIKLAKLRRVMEVWGPEPPCGPRYNSNTPSERSFAGYIGGKLGDVADGQLAYFPAFRSSNEKLGLLVIGIQGFRGGLPTFILGLLAFVWNLGLLKSHIY